MTEYVKDLFNEDDYDTEEVYCSEVIYMPYIPVLFTKTITVNTKMITYNIRQKSNYVEI